MAILRPTRAERNCNPGNIRHGTQTWQGQTAAQNDPDFVTFSANSWGFRAMAVTLRNYQTLHGLHCLRDIISRWAPASENPTSNYVDFVCTRVGVSPDANVELSDASLLILVCAAIAEFESGFPWQFADVQDGVRAA